MRRLILISCVALGALLAVLGAAAWVQSYLRPHAVPLFVGSQRAYFLDSTHGRLVLIRQGFDARGDSPRALLRYHGAVPAS